MNHFIRTLIALMIISVAMPGFSQSDVSKEESSRSQGLKLKKITDNAQRNWNFDIRIDNKELESAIELAVVNAMKSLDVSLEKLERLEINIDPIEIDLQDLNIEIDPIVISIPNLNIDIEPIEIELDDLDSNIDHDDFDFNFNDDGCCDDNDHEKDKHKDKHKDDHEKSKLKHKSDKQKSNKSDQKENDKSKGLKRIY